MSTEQSTQDIIPGGRFMGLFVGPQKTAKTCAAATFPGPVKVYDFDGRMASVQFMWPDLDIKYVIVGPRAYTDRNIISYADFCEEWEQLQDYCPWETVILDSFTMMSNTAITFQLLARSGGKLKLSDIKKTKGGLPTPGFDEYNGETTSITMILDVAKILPCNVIMTAHPINKTETDKDGKVVRKYSTIASYGNKIAQIAPVGFTEIWRFEYEASFEPGGKPKYFVYTVPSGDVVAATALPLPAKMEVTNRKLYNVVKEELKKAEIRLQEQAKIVKI